VVLYSKIAKWHNIARRFWREPSGGVAIIFALTATTLVALLGAGLDLSRAYVARQQLSNVAALTCQYSARPEVMSTAYSNTNGTATYIAQVNAYATRALAQQNFNLTQNQTSPFSYTGLGGTSSVSLSATVPTLFLPIVSINSLPVSMVMSCHPGETESTSNSGTTILTESFENSACSGVCYTTFNSDGTKNQPPSVPGQTFPSTTGYVGTTNTQWSIMGYCIEIDAAGKVRTTVADGTHSAELDCDNGSYSAGNSSISNKSYYAAGSYELRYSYASRVGYPNYDPSYICGSTAADVSWANDTYSSGWGVTNALRTNQLNVYFDADQNGAPPTHQTIDGTQTLAGSNLIDMCVQSMSWIQRSVKFTVTSAGYYWLSFAADGANDSYGASIDAISVCPTSCSGSVQDNFPSAWTTTPLLFEDTFDSPTVPDTYSTGFNANETLDHSYGTTSTGTGGWPSQQSTGWATSPYDQLDYLLRNSDQGSQSLELDADLNAGQSTSNRTISRYFYLDPGYYQIKYDYISDANFTSMSGTHCTYAPSSISAYGYTGKLFANIRQGGSGNFGNDTNVLAVFMSHGELISTPIGGGGLNSVTTYLNPNGTITTTPAVSPTYVNVSSYDPSQVNPLLDYCYFSAGWTTRTTYVKITKAGPYWLSFAAQGSADNTGIALDDVRVTALNSLYGASPSFAVAVPTPTPANGATISYTGFSFIADPLTP